jgi:hypothetical protein
MIALSVAMICSTLIAAQLLHYAFKNEQMEWKDNIRLGAELETKIEEMDKPKKQVDVLLLKSGMGR